MKSTTGAQTFQVVLETGRYEEDRRLRKLRAVGSTRISAVIFSSSNGSRKYIGITWNYNLLMILGTYVLQIRCHELPFSPCIPYVNSNKTLKRWNRLCLTTSSGLGLSALFGPKYTFCFIILKFSAIFITLQWHQHF